MQMNQPRRADLRRFDLLFLLLEVELPDFLRMELIKSNWEGERTAFAEQRPPRKYYRLTRESKGTLAKALERYALFEQLVTAEKSKRRKGESDG